MEQVFDIGGNGPLGRRSGVTSVENTDLSVVSVAVVLTLSKLRVTQPTETQTVQALRPLRLRGT